QGLDQDQSLAPRGGAQIEHPLPRLHVEAERRPDGRRVEDVVPQEPRLVPIGVAPVVAAAAGDPDGPSARVVDVCREAVPTCDWRGAIQQRRPQARPLRTEGGAVVRLEALGPAQGLSPLLRQTTRFSWLCLEALRL